MATASSLIDMVYNAFCEDIPNNAVKVIKSFSGGYQDLPLSKPTVAVGIGGLELTGPLDAEGHPQNVRSDSSVYGRFTVRADVCIPVSMGSGSTEMVLDMLMVAAKGLSGGFFTVSSIVCGDTKYSRVIDGLVTTVNINMLQTLY